MKRNYLLAATILVPVLAYAAGAGPAAVMMNRVPPIPGDPQSAYAQWVDNNNDLKPGAAFKALEDAIRGAQMQDMRTATHIPTADQQASAQATAAQYNTPEGRARLASMSPAQLLTLGQQMQTQLGYAPPPQPTAVSEHDSAIMRQLGVYAKTAEVRTKTASIQMASAKLQQQWDADRDGIGREEDAAKSKLPVCSGEAGEPSGLAMRQVELAYADKRIKLAANYLPKFVPYLQQLKQTVAPEIDYGDNAMAQWAKLQNPALKSQTRAIVVGARSNGFADAGVVLGFVEGVSKKAAQSVADKHNIERTYADAKGCS